MSNYVNHAMQEFRAAGWVDENDNYKDGMQKMICNHVLELLDAFADEGHSGFSANYAIELFTKLAKFEPISPLTGEDCEWVDVSIHGVPPRFQNKRHGAVFKDPDKFDGQAYYIDANVFWEWCKDSNGNMNKCYYTGHGSSQPITFPYTPVIKYVFSPTKEFPDEVL